MKVVRAKIGAGRELLEAVVIQTRDGISAYVGGGEYDHVGTVVICHSRPSLKKDGSMSSTASVINMLGHKDDALAAPFARRLCEASRQTVVVTAGVHVDQATGDDIQGFLARIGALADQAIARLELPREE
jgi:hypothetical protein